MLFVKKIRKKKKKDQNTMILTTSTISFFCNKQIYQLWIKPNSQCLCFIPCYKHRLHSPYWKKSKRGRKKFYLDQVRTAPPEHRKIAHSLERGPLMTSVTEVLKQQAWKWVHETFYIHLLMQNNNTALACSKTIRQLCLSLKLNPCHFSKWFMNKTKKRF